jgi:nucleoside-diphosphate kinase
MSTKTLVLLKPDAVERGLVGEIIGRLERKGLRIVAMELRTLDADTLGRHYEEHKGKGFYADLVSFMSRGPVVSLAVEGPEDTWEIVRAMMGATNPRAENLIHGSDSADSAARELSIFFPTLK